MSSNPGRTLRWTIGLLLGVAGVAAWVQMMTASGNGWSIEPSSDAAIAAAAADRPTAIGWSLVLMAVAGAMAAVTRRRWVAVLALPGVVVAACELLVPTANGAAFFYGLVVSLLAVIATLSLEVRHRLRMRERAAARPDAP